MRKAWRTGRTVESIKLILRPRRRGWAATTVLSCFGPCFPRPEGSTVHQSTWERKRATKYPPDPQEIEACRAADTAALECSKKGSTNSLFLFGLPALVHNSLVFVFLLVTDGRDVTFSLSGRGGGGSPEGEKECRGSHRQKGRRRDGPGRYWQEPGHHACGTESEEKGRRGEGATQHYMYIQ